MSEYSWDLKHFSSSPYVWYKDGFTSDEIDSIVSLGDQSQLEQAKISLDNVPQIIMTTRNSKVCFLPSENNEWIFQRLTSIINEVNERYFQFELHQLQTLQFGIYDKNGFYGKHIDSFVASGFYSVRKLSFSLLLSDPKDYKGGNLLLHTSSTPTEIERSRGLICFFPSYTLHEVTPVTKGVRKSLVGWVTGPPFR